MGFGVEGVVGGVEAPWDLLLSSLSRPHRIVVRAVWVCVWPRGCFEVRVVLFDGRMGMLLRAWVCC